LKEAFKSIGATYLHHVFHKHSFILASEVFTPRMHV